MPSAGSQHQLLEQIRLSGLTGRGGAGFPTAVKLRAVAAAPGTAVVVANGAEGEPASSKDRQLLLGAPHLVLDGLQVAARLTGADQALIYVRADAAAAVRRALAERVAAGEDPIPVTVVEAADGFVTGQETAVVSPVERWTARPQFARVRVTERGVGGSPGTGPECRDAGPSRADRPLRRSLVPRGRPARCARDLPGHRAPSPGRGGVGAGSEPGEVWEVPQGLPLGELLRASTGEPVEALSAVLIGGYHGRWLPLPEALDTPLSTAGLVAFGGTLGAGVVLPLAADDCGLEATARIVRYLATESAPQCGPCQFGLPHLASLLSVLADVGRRGVRNNGLTAIREAVGLVEGRGACHHPDGTARLVRSALTVFEKDVVMHGIGRCAARSAHAQGENS